MNIEKYIAHLQQVAKKYPKAKVIYAIDEEGNGYDEVFFTPTPGRFEDGEFDRFDGNKNVKVNAICIN